MPKLQRASPLAVAAFAAIGLAVGLLVQFARSTWGFAPLVPPISLPATLVVLGAVLLVLGIMLRRAVTRRSKRAVDPFHAVRLLAGARAALFAGALFAGFGTGLLLQLLTRSVAAPTGTWLPILLTLIAGVLLAVCGVIVESLCRVPPDDPETDAASEDDADSAPRLTPDPS